MEGGSMVKTFLIINKNLKKTSTCTSSPYLNDSKFFAEFLCLIGKCL